MLQANIIPGGGGISKRNSLKSDSEWPSRLLQQWRRNTLSKQSFFFFFFFFGGGGQAIDHKQCLPSPPQKKRGEKKTFVFSGATVLQNWTVGAAVRFELYRWREFVCNNAVAGLAR